MRNYIVLFVGCLLFHLAGTWSLPLIDRDEPRFAEAAREMRERDDFIVPYFNDQFRFDKPPLTYWFQVASYRVFGENDFAARFPTAVAAALVALVLFSWGKRVRSEKVGWWAAIIFTLSLQTFIHGKAAVADMWLVLFVTIAHLAGWELFKANTEHRTPNAERRTKQHCPVIRCSAFGSSALLHPRFPTAFEHEHVRNLRFLAQPFCYFASEIATFRTAINNNLFARRPPGQKLRQQFIPPVFI